MAVSRVITFAPSVNIHQEINVSITIVTDTTNEDDESFNCILRTVEQNMLVSLIRNVTTIIILNDDGNYGERTNTDSDYYVIFLQIV